MVRRSGELVVIGLAVSLLLELSARVYLFGLAGLVPAKINSEHYLPQTGFTQPSSIPGLHFELKPDVDGYFKRVPFRTNSRGLRDRDYALEKPARCFRVAVMGSSFALPTGVAIEDAFHSLLEERLSEEFAPTRYQFVNFSVGMFNVGNMIATLESRALRYDPDLVLFSVTKLSILGLRRAGERSEPARGRPRELPRFERTFPILQSFLVRLVSSRLWPDAPPRVNRVGWLERRFIDLRARFAPEPAATGAPRPTVEGQTGANPDPDPLLRLAAIRQRTGIPIAVIHLEFEPAPRLPDEIAVEARARELDIPYLDTRDAFRDTRYRELWIDALDPHPNARAHAIFADAIDAFLRAEALLPGARS